VPEAATIGWVRVTGTTDVVRGPKRAARPVLDPVAHLTLCRDVAGLSPRCQVAASLTDQIKTTFPPTKF
jgi:hypothetical protein